MTCQTCKFLITKEKMDGSIDRSCRIDGRPMGPIPIVKCTAWEELEVKKSEKK